MNVTKEQIVILQTIINKDGHLKAAKAELLRGASGGRTESCKELTMEEARDLIQYLKKGKPNPNSSPKGEGLSDPSYKMRGKILSMAHEMGWHRKDANGNVIRNAEGKPKVDFLRVNNWCVQYGFGKKKLDKYTYEELPKLVTVFEKVFKGYLKGF